MARSHIVLIRPKTFRCLTPLIAVFENSPDAKAVSLEVDDFETAMRQFKLTVQLDTTVAKQVYPYNNAIGLIYEGGEDNIVDQVDSFDFMDGEQEVRIYSVDNTVDVRSIRGVKVVDWADVEALNKIFAHTHGVLEREILQRTFAILPRIEF